MDSAKSASYSLVGIQVEEFGNCLHLNCVDRKFISLITYQESIKIFFPFFTPKTINSEDMAFSCHVFWVDVAHLMSVLQLWSPARSGRLAERHSQIPSSYVQNQSWNQDWPAAPEVLEVKFTAISLLVENMDITFGLPFLAVALPRLPGPTINLCLLTIDLRRSRYSSF